MFRFAAVTHNSFKISVLLRHITHCSQPGTSRLDSTSSCVAGPLLFYNCIHLVQFGTNSTNESRSPSAMFSLQPQQQPASLLPPSEVNKEKPHGCGCDPPKPQMPITPSPDVPQQHHTMNSTQPKPPGLENVPECVLKVLREDPVIWVFGYGSLLWKTEFPYRSKLVGFVEGYVRRFYQGNETFRGKPGQTARVANLVPEQNGRAWGVAYEVRGQEDVTETLKRLYKREAVGGGYVTEITTFYPRGCGHMASASSRESLSSLVTTAEGEEEAAKETGETAEQTSVSPEGHAGNEEMPRENGASREKKPPRPVQVLLYTVTPDNDLYLGPDDLDSMARQIVAASGSAGSNVEYVTKTADYVRKFIPEDEDSHLFQLEVKVRELVHIAHGQGSERVRLGLSDLAHDLPGIARDLEPQAGIVKAS